MLTIYKASAGSGKTFRLVVEYLKLILSDELNYKHILAVTFTNKATAEMKERVVSQLSEIAKGGGNAYSDIVAKETGLPLSTLKQKARAVLRNILHDYSRFSVSTIDKFTQRVLKAFNRELGITPGYILELDNEMILQEAADRLIMGVSSNKDLLKWLKNLGEERIRNNKNFNIKTEILKLGQELFKEHFQVFFSGEDKELYGRGHLKQYSIELSRIINFFVSELKKKGEKALSLIREEGLDVSDFSYGKSGVAGFFLKLSEGDIPQLGARVLKAGEGCESWVSKKHHNRDSVTGLIERALLPLLNEAIDFHSQHFIKYNTAKKIVANLYTLGILNDLQSEIDKIRYEKGILPISDSNLLLKKIIGGSDTPFIYEKIGNIFHHFMLDEFQDTSGLQWENFKPLVLNAMAEGKSNLVVGDVKQSIYRWRNSNWKILANEIEEDFKGQNIKLVSLGNNWRSSDTVIHFNNSIFPLLVDSFSGEYANHITEAGCAPENPFTSIFEKIYTGIEQIPGGRGKPREGFVRISFIEGSEDEDYQSQSTQLLLQQVKELQGKGFKSSDIAILIRRKADGLPIIKQFLEASEEPGNAAYNFDIISNESLFLSSSKSVSFVIQLVTHLINPGDKIVKATILNEYKNYLQPALHKLNKGIVYTTIQNDGQHQFNFTPQGNTETCYQLTDLFEDEFEAIFTPIIGQLKTAILNASIDEAITMICRAFNLFELKEDVPFIQALIDQSAQVKTNFTNDLSNFLKWWDEKGANLSVNVNDDTDAIRLFTVHKSKGLEFKVVLIPFFDWPILWSGTQTPTIWCQPKEAPFDILPLVPVSANKTMAQTIFAEEYSEEVASTFIDCLNLIYVAFTRAKSVLMVNAPYKENDKTLTANRLLFNIVAQLGEKDEWKGNYSPESLVFQYGALAYEKQSGEKEKTEAIFSEKYFFTDFNPRLKLRSRLGNFFSEEAGATNKNLGQLLHEILAEVIVAGDVGKACKNALRKRKINTKEYAEIYAWLTTLINSPGAKDWFSTRYTVLNERPLLSKEKNKRPDRIMLSGNEAIIVDYKIDEIESDKYKNQVTGYSQGLKNTGIKKVTGYLWFLKPNRIEKVCEL